ncbi:MAG: DMT family transporter [Actinomycetaceae bacterium]|nr:DMT family transporter [Arcanobacterium sp.]MDD7504636.1 DMT family transporter [Actinomycetaceae bacterium]
MRYGIISGMTWAIDTLILGIALGMTPFVDSQSAVALAAITSAFLHDFFCAVWMFAYMAVRRRLKDTCDALRTPAGRGVIFGALLGGPVGMTGYLIAIDNIGPSYTAIISTFYPAFGTLLAFVFLKERMRPHQILALMTALLAIVVMGYSSAGEDGSIHGLLGLLGALLCVVAWGSEAVIGAWSMRSEVVDNEVALHIRETTSALAYGILVVPMLGSWEFTLSTVWTAGNGVVLLAALAGTVSYLAYYKAISRIGAAKGMALNISYSAWAVVFAFLFMKEVPSVLEVVCCVVIMCGTILAAANIRDLVPTRRK